MKKVIPIPSKPAFILLSNKLKKSEILKMFQISNCKYPFIESVNEKMSETKSDKKRKIVPKTETPSTTVYLGTTGGGGAPGVEFDFGVNQTVLPQFQRIIKQENSFDSTLSSKEDEVILKPAKSTTSSTTSRQRWSSAEDTKLVELVKTNHGAAIDTAIGWNEISAHLPGRSEVQCRARWKNHLQPDLVKGNFVQYFFFLTTLYNFIEFLNIFL